MGMCAELIAVGPYSKSVCTYLDYPPERYASTMEGAVISRRLFGILQGSTVSREFAGLLGIVNPWVFSQHKVLPSRVDVAGLREFGVRYSEYEEDVRAFEALLSAGFEFHFRPEG